ncbi:AT-rich interactive domain-containing protein 3A isoform X1 [Salvelinus sp. IW2-2015]|uniref:AT-rich interactive domain-containing protein 3A isoform X1 n=1 Tax=Salvelinus sp. IW2-2015 TaxID=2691554 RepID=UPI0038D3B4C6
MKLQAVMENLHRQQRAKLLMELEQQQLQQDGARGRTTAGVGDQLMGSPAPESEHAQMAALAAMRAVAAGLQRASDSPMSERSSGGEDEEEEDDDEEEEGEQYKDMMGSEEEEMIKQKWDEEDFEGEMEEDYEDELVDEGLPTGREALAMLLPHRQLHAHSQLLKQARPRTGTRPDQEPRMAILPPHGSHSQLGGQDHGDWTYEEQFRQPGELCDSSTYQTAHTSPPSSDDPWQEASSEESWPPWPSGLKSGASSDGLQSGASSDGLQSGARYEGPQSGVDDEGPRTRGATKLYELDGDPKRKEFLDDLFSFMQKRGTPVNRIPIMAKQVLDLYMLYQLVTEKGGLVEVINKKLWREITKGLNLPTSITSAAFTLRTQYMKYLYPYECDKRSLSNPNELQAAIDCNRREGRRQSFGNSLFTYSPNGTPTMLSSPKLSMQNMGMNVATNGGHSLTPIQKIKKEEEGGQPVSGLGFMSRHPLVGNSAAAVQAAAAQLAALEQLRDRLEAGEPPEKKIALPAEKHQRLLQRALQHNLLARTAQMPMNIRINNQDSRQDSALNLTTNGMSSISMSVELNGVMYTGVLFAQAAGSASSGPSGSSSNSKAPGGHGGS